MRRASLLASVALSAACRRAAPPRPAPRATAAASLADAGADVLRLARPPAPVVPTAFRFDPAHSGRSGFRLPRRPRVAARVLTGARISAQPVAWGDGGVAVGSHDGVLYAARPDGGVAWRFATGDRIYTTALGTTDGTLYVGTDADRFLAVSARGRLRVALATEDDADTSPALAADGSLRFASGRTLYSVGPDLTVRFRVDFGAKIYSSPALLPDGTAVFGCQDDAVYAVGPDGAVRWRFVTGGDVDAPPALDADGNVYVGSDDGTFYSLTSAGVERWRRPLGGYVRAGAALNLDDTLVVGTYGPRARIVALDRDDGAVRWEVPIAGPPTAEYGIASAALVDRDGAIAVGAPDDALYLLARDGRVTARVAFPADVDSGPALLADGVLAVGCDDGALYVLTD